MFSKKILGLVGLLFIGSKVKAAIPSCSFGGSEVNCDNSDGDGNYCYNSSESKLYYYEVGVCKLGVTDKVLFIDGTGSEVENVTATDTDNGESLNMYYCDSNSCVDTKGYVKNGSNYFLIKEDKASLASTVTVDSATTCTGNVGKLVTYDGDTYLCLTQNKSVKLDGEVGVSYLAFNLGDLELDANKDDNTKVVITKKPNVLLVNTLYETDGEPHCYDSTNASIMPRIDNFCKGEKCDKYYDCTEGVCTLQKDVCPRGPDGRSDLINSDTTTCNPITSNKCNKGYYLYSESEGLIVTGGVGGKLYHCEQKEDAGGAKKRGDIIECTDVKSIPTGYFKNTAYDSGKAALDDDHNAQYIKCTSTGTGTVTCEAITVNSGECSTDGLVYLDKSGNGNINLCLDRGIVNGVNDKPISIILNGEGAVEGDYFIKVSDSGNIFGSESGGKYTIVTVESGNVVKYSFDFSEGSEDNKLFRYAGDNYKVLTKNDGSKSRRRDSSEDVSVCGNVKDLYEFKIICSVEVGHTNEGTGYYEHDNTNRNTNYRNIKPDRD